MNARYLLRLDDACETMNGTRWSRLEAALDDLGVHPIVAVVPENRDPALRADPPDPFFWDKVRNWQGKGWTIAMHGYQHTFHDVPRKELVLPFYDRSEFAGLAWEDQARKMRLSWAAFEARDVRPAVWIAPAHCFDRTTLQALKTETPIRLVSDGIACDQYFEDGLHWLPQQLWCHIPRRSGLWTICLHPNSMEDHEIDRLHASLEPLAAHGAVTSVRDVELSDRRRSLKDRVYAAYFWNRTRVHRAVSAVRVRAGVRSEIE